uniref:Uncharacterized protein n=1 Tax=Leersia perrieri TaxID=77586 RepID=A0A0D9VXG8_9ORYZ
MTYTRRRCRRRSAPRVVRRQSPVRQHVCLRLRHARLHDHNPHGLQYVYKLAASSLASRRDTTMSSSSCYCVFLSRVDERRAAVHEGGHRAKRPSRSRC